MASRRRGRSGPRSGHRVRAARQRSRCGLAMGGASSRWPSAGALPPRARPGSTWSACWLRPEGDSARHGSQPSGGSRAPRAGTRRSGSGRADLLRLRLGSLGDAQELSFRPRLLRSGGLARVSGPRFHIQLCAVPLLRPAFFPGSRPLRAPLLAWAVFRRRTALVLIPAALLYGLVVTTVVMPAIRDGQPGDLVARYSYLGSSVPGILLGLVTRPELIVIHLLSPGPLLAVVLLLGGVGFLPLARPLALAAALPPLLLALLSQHWQQETLLDQYGLQPGPLIFVGALIGWVRLSAKWSSSVIGAALLASTLAALALAAPAPALGSLAKGQAAASLANALPPDASVDASNDLLPMLAERDSIGLLPARGRDWIAVDESMESTEFVAELGSQGYVLVRRSGELSLWRRQAQQRATYG